jgi:hypothetical protein
MNQATYESLLSNYGILYDNGKAMLDELKDYIINERQIDCNSDSDSSIAYFLFGKKMRTKLQCSYSNLRSRKGFIVTYTEMVDENRIKIMSFTRELSFGVDGKIETTDDYPSGYFMEIFDTFRKDCQPDG